jgi:hypothetical protein
VAEAKESVGLAVVGAEGGQVGAVLDHVGDQCLEVLARRALADEQPHPLLAAFVRVLEPGGLVVGLGAGGQVGVERPAGHARAVPVHAPVPRRGDAGEHLRVAADHAREVHDLGHSAGAVALDQLAHVAGVERRAGALERGGGHAARGVDAERERQRRGGLGQSGDAGHAEHVRDLVRVGGDGRRAVRQHGADELVDPELGRLEVHVGIDERRRERAPGHVHDLVRVALAPPGDRAVGDRHCRVDPLARGRAEHAPSRDQQVGRLVAARDRDRPGRGGRTRHYRLRSTVASIRPNGSVVAWNTSPRSSIPKRDTS